MVFERFDKAEVYTTFLSEQDTGLNMKAVVATRILLVVVTMALLLHTQGEPENSAALLV